MNVLSSHFVSHVEMTRLSGYQTKAYCPCVSTFRRTTRNKTVPLRHCNAIVISASSDVSSPSPLPVHFHQARMAASDRPDARAQHDSRVKLKYDVLEAKSDSQLEASSWLRAVSFYAYPPERKFAGDIHQMMVAEEELKALKAARLAQSLNKQEQARSACIVVVALVQDLVALGLSPEQIDGDGRLYISSETGGNEKIVVGTLDVHGVRALPGEVLIGSSTNAAYLANVCAAPCVRRLGVGKTLLGAARVKAREWGVDDMYVHTQAVNEIALRFYQRHGFVKEKEETANQAHYRGRCLDGIEGRGRTILLRDTLLWEVGREEADYRI
jgi:ribosomal protein S18 acetylase RimI-like enzyme